MAAVVLTFTVLASSAGGAAAAQWEAGYLLTNYESSSGADFLRVLDADGTLVEDVAITGGDKWTSEDHIGWCVAAYDARSVFCVTTDSHGIYSVDVQEHHKVTYVTTLPKDIKGVVINDVNSLAVDPDGRLFAGVSTGCLDNSPHNCIANYVVRYELKETDGSLRPTKVDAFPFVTHDLAMSQDGSILYGLDDPMLFGGARAIRQLNLTTMVPLPAFVVRSDSSCSALAAGGPQGPIVACHGAQHPIDTKPAAIPEGSLARAVKSRQSEAVATATRLATNTQVNATYVWAYSPKSATGAATLTKVNTSTGEAITPGLTTNVPSSLRALTVIPGVEVGATVPKTTTTSLRRQLRGLRSFVHHPRIHVHKLWD